MLLQFLTWSSRQHNIYLYIASYRKKIRQRSELLHSRAHIFETTGDWRYQENWRWFLSGRRDIVNPTPLGSGETAVSLLQTKDYGHRSTPVWNDNTAMTILFDLSSSQTIDRGPELSPQLRIRSFHVCIPRWHFPLFRRPRLGSRFNTTFSLDVTRVFKTTYDVQLSARRRIAHCSCPPLAALQNVSCYPATS